ncbi:MAG TPA: sensor domain-containing diguanylate cyclase [Pyrinomonadaceae bacterium]|jgi:diguanylate cyclase (GGDEF)-like protein
MKQAKQKAKAGKNRKKTDLFDFLLPVVSLCAIAATFLLGFSDFGYKNRIIIFSLIIVVYSVFYVFDYLRRKSPETEFTDAVAEKEFEKDVQNKLFALEEANDFFGSTLKPADLLRLVSSRIGELISFDACAFLVADENKKLLKVAFAYGTNAKAFKNQEISIEKGAGGKAFTNEKICIDKNLRLDKRAYSQNIIQSFQTAISAPIFCDGKAIGVLQLFNSRLDCYDSNSAELLKAVSERVAPLFAGSVAFERSLSNALTDSLTNLPNERAFFVVLENQIAEATRFKAERPLTILSIDIDNFSEFNRKFGHATGDCFLAFTGQNIKNQLRQMDFLARSAGDEFSVVLPTADERIAVEIIERIERSFAAKPFEINDNEKVFVKLNFGAATFGRDGETATQLLNTSCLRKKQSKSSKLGNVLLFPVEFAN